MTRISKGIVWSLFFGLLILAVIGMATSLGYLPEQKSLLKAVRTNAVFLGPMVAVGIYLLNEHFVKRSDLQFSFPEAVSIGAGPNCTVVPEGDGPHSDPVIKFRSPLNIKNEGGLLGTIDRVQISEISATGLDKELQYAHVFTDSMDSYVHFRSQDGKLYQKEVKGHTFSGAELEAIVYIDPEILDTVVEQLSAANDIEVEFTFEIFDSEGRYERTQEIQFPFQSHHRE